MHKSVDVARLQEKVGSSCGVCCQKVRGAEPSVRGGIRDVLFTNQVREPAGGFVLLNAVVSALARKSPLIDIWVVPSTA